MPVDQPVDAAMAAGASRDQPSVAEEPTSGGAQTRGPSLGTSRRWIPVLGTYAIPMLVMLVVGLWGLAGGDMWRDEAATYHAAHLSLGQLWHLVHHIDVVHGTYYLLMHLVVAMGGPGIVVLRLASVAAAVVATGGVVLVGRRLAGSAVGFVAGLLFAVTPLTSRYAQEARSVPFIAAGVVLATYLLLVAWDRPSTRRWTAYAACMVVTTYINEMALLMLIVHGVVLLLQGAWRRPWRVPVNWVITSAAIVVLSLPILIASLTQTGQVAWVRPVNWKVVAKLATAFAGPHLAIVAATLAVALIGLVATRGPGPSRLRTLAFVWLVIPPGTLILASLVKPIYDVRYIYFSLPGLCLLTGLGINAVVRSILTRLRPSSPLRQAASVSAVVAVIGMLAAGGAFAVQLPVQRGLRGPLGHMDSFNEVAAVISEHTHPGDAVVFVPTMRRLLEYVFPHAFTNTKDILQLKSPTASGTLSGTQVRVAQTRSRLMHQSRVWLIMSRRGYPAAEDDRRADHAALSVLANHFTVVREFHPHGFNVWLFVRDAT
ncbi:MAG: glycosyltransferase family 39 protein [Nocardioidaceae bacterium]